MQLDLTGKVVVVTGAGRGIGRVIASRFAEEHAIVQALDVDAAAVDSVASEFVDRGWVGTQQLCDVRDAASVARAVDAVLARFGRIDVLINNAGVIAPGFVDELDPAAWERCFAVNVTGTFLMCRAVIPAMKAQRSGRIINAASFAAIIPSIRDAAYGASKAAVVQFTRTLASELGPWGITANSYAPGMIPTELNGFATEPPEEQERRLDQLSIRRWGSGEDVADLLCFLASDRSGYITGTLQDVSGGKFATQAPGTAHRSRATDRERGESRPSA